MNESPRANAWTVWHCKRAGWMSLAGALGWGAAIFLRQTGGVGADSIGGWLLGVCPNFSVAWLLAGLWWILGALIGRKRWRMSFYFAGLIAVFIVLCVSEVYYVLFWGRIFDPSDLLASGVALGVAWLLMRPQPAHSYSLHDKR